MAEETATQIETALHHLLVAVDQFGLYTNVGATPWRADAFTEQQVSAEVALNEVESATVTGTAWGRVI